MATNLAVFTLLSRVSGRQHAVYAQRDIIVMENPSTRLSVCVSQCLMLNDLTYRQTFLISGRGIILVFRAPLP